MVDERYGHDVYTIRRKILTLIGASFHVYDPEGRLVFFCRQKAFKLKEDIRLFAEEAKVNEILTMKARQIIDFGATYDVFDPVANETVGSLRRKGLKSMLRDEWLFHDTDGRQIAVIREDSVGLALLRRLHPWVAMLLPQKYLVEMEGQPVCTFRQHFNPLVMKITADFTGDAEGMLDRRLGIAAGILLCAIEGKQGR